jgi:hypothetical protein
LAYRPPPNAQGATAIGHKRLRARAFMFKVKFYPARIALSCEEFVRCADRFAQFSQFGGFARRKSDKHRRFVLVGGFLCVKHPNLHSVRLYKTVDTSQSHTGFNTNADGTFLA